MPVTLRLLSSVGGVSPVRHVAAIIIQVSHSARVPVPPLVVDLSEVPVRRLRFGDRRSFVGPQDRDHDCDHSDAGHQNEKSAGA